MRAIALKALPTKFAELSKPDASGSASDPGRQNRPPVARLPADRRRPSGVRVNPFRTILRKREGEELSREEIVAFLRGYAEERIGDGPMAAFLMAAFFRGLSAAELAAMVDVMLHSGVVIDLGAVKGTKVDKHSTGGVGDKVSLVLAPLVASLGVPVPMMSGRGLGHTGGTVDKLESIPGFRTDLTLTEYRAQVERVGCALIAQTDEVAPLDRRLYALRDATATVESIPFIASSIMSKKLAEGIDALVLDVKLGNGAFIPEPDRAAELARTMIAIGEEYGKRVIALHTAMDRPLGSAIGNALEVVESIEALKGGGPADLRAVTLALAAEMLVLGGVAASREEAVTAGERALDDGRALEKFRDIIAAQDGDARIIDDASRLPRASVQKTVVSPHAGFIASFDVRAIGLAAITVGAGRGRLDATIDPGAGFRMHVTAGTAVQQGDAIATVYAADRALAEEAGRELLAAIRIAPAMTEQPLPLIGPRIPPA
jgi:pyrimidine-nucleoside phosphorylase